MADDLELLKARARAKQKRAQAMAAQAGPEPKPFNVLPFSEDRQGNVTFDSDAGALGVIKRVFRLPQQVYSGEVDPYSSEGAERTAEAALMTTPLGAASRAVPGGLLSSSSAYRQPAKPAPTREALKEATTAGYGEARAMGAEYTPSAIAEWATQTAAALDREGRIAPNYPKVHRLLDALKDPPEGARSVTLESIDALYKELGRLAGDPAEGRVASLVQKGLDDFHANMGADALVAGTASPQRAAGVLREARGNAAAGFRSDRVTGLEQTSARRTAAANSGRNTDNAIRQRLTSLIESAKGSRGLSKEEEAAIDNIIFGSRKKNAARYVGNALGGGGGLGSTLLSGAAGVGGATALGPLGAALGAVPPVLGAGARGMANRMSRRELSQLDELMRSRSPLANSTPTPAPVYQPGAVQGGAEMGLRAVAPGTLPVYEPEWMKQQKAKAELIRALIGPDGA